METNKLIDRLRELSKIGIVNYKHDTPVLIEAADRIEELDERIAIMQESMEALEKRCNALDALEQRCKALETLEKQEQPKSVYDPRLCNNSPKAYKGFCPWCNSVITLIHGKFCDKCGKAVKWK